jgi:hypothetical protein|tara:strand:- start:1645 stop:1782 length:138 start_codon:yes stop_codon:yes gene_type:complete
VIKANHVPSPKENKLLASTTEKIADDIVGRTDLTGIVAIDNLGQS